MNESSAYAIWIGYTHVLVTPMVNQSPLVQVVHGSLTPAELRWLADEVERRESTPQPVT